MLMFHIRIITGSTERLDVYHFTYKDQETASEEEQKKAFDKAVKELNHIYNDYGRFATSRGVCKLFEKFGFDRVIP